jgi:acetate kinase
LNILVFNGGSSSLGYKLYTAVDAQNLQTVHSGKAHRVGVHGSEPSFIEQSSAAGTEKQIVPIADQRTAAALILQHLRETGAPVDCVGHRFLHGGSYFHDNVFLDSEVLQKLEICRPLAPIHNPNSLDVIYECLAALPGIPEYVALDNAYHATIPPEANTYPLPAPLVEKFGFRKYGFHGLSYSYVARVVPRFLGRPAAGLRMVACHLGTGGSSVAAIRDGRSLDTSMGFTPLPGLVMSTRCGDVDPSLPVYLEESHGYTPAQLSALFNNQSGLLALSGFSSDIRDLTRRAAETGDEAAQLAVDMYVYRIRKYIGSYVVALGGLDALVFTDDIGVQSPLVRARACSDLAWCGVALDSALNERVSGDRICLINAPVSRVNVVTVPADEERVIALEGLELMERAR